MQNEQNTQNIILQLRNLIKNHSKPVLKQSYSNFIKKAPSQKDFEKMLMESSRLISQEKQSVKKIQTKNKIIAASELLKDQKSNLIKNYIKDKISSQIFSNKTSLTQEQSILFEQQKQQALLQREKQIEQQKQRRKNIIQNIRQYDNNPTTSIPILQIDRILQKQEPDSSYLIKYMNNQSKKLSSSNNKIKNTNLTIEEIYSIQEYEKRQSPQKHSPQKQNQIQEQFQQVQGQLQQQNVEAQYMANSKEGRVYGLLSKKINFVKIFYKFLQNQCKINALNNVYQGLPGFIQNEEQKLNKQRLMNQKYLWTNKPKKYIKKQIKKQSISQVTKIFRVKGILIVPNASVKLQQSIICEKQINKMIGQSDKFHSKKCILTNEQLLYFQQNAEKASYKTIQLILQKIQTKAGKKDQGSFFSKKEEDIEIAIIKGKNRVLKFEKNYLQGKDLYYQISKLMNLKLHFLNCKIHGRSNNSVMNFILNQKAQKLDLGNQYLQLIQNYPAQEYRQMSLQLLLQLFAYRKQIKHLQLQFSRLTPIQITYILNNCQILKQLQIINLENNRLQKENIQTLFQLINKSDGVKNFKINLCNTKIDDEMINGNSGIISLASQKINYLNLSKNSITAKSVNVIKNCLEIVTCQIKHLEINQCSIKEISKVSALIKQAKKLQILSLKECELELDQKQENELQQFFSSFKRTVIKQIYLNGNGCLSKMNMQLLQSYWSGQNPQHVFFDVKLDQLQRSLQTDEIPYQIKLLKGKIETSPSKAN